MPAGFIQFDPAPAPLSRPKVSAGVYGYGGGSLSPLPNVECLSIQDREGPYPTVAQFRYKFDSVAAALYGQPARIDDVFPLTASGAAVVQAGDRIVVMATDPNGNPQYLFDGFAKVPEADLGRDAEVVTFQAIGVAEREFDEPIDGSIYRDASDPTLQSDVATGIPARFNPDGRANAVAAADEGNDEGSGWQFPALIDPLVCKQRGYGRKWTLEMAARYVLRYASSSSYISIPAGGDVQFLLQALVPVAGPGGTLDPSNPATYNREDIKVRDVSIQGKAWPDALWELIRPHGFGMRFELSSAGGLPRTSLVLWRKAVGDGKNYQDVFLQNPGADLDPGAWNLGAAKVQRDTAKVANRVAVESDLEEYEATFVLAPGFRINAGADPAGKANYRQGGNPNWADRVNDYRLFVLDETGEGHWDMDDAEWVTGSAADLTPVLGNENDGLIRPNDPGDIGKWVERRRVGKHDLLSTDEQGKPRRAMLEFSYDYNGPSPGVYRGGGTWTPLKGEWRLLDDRLGIYITAQDPNALDAGGTNQFGGTNAGRHLRLVEKLGANPIQKVWFRLTTVIEADQTAEVVADRRAASPGPFTVTQLIDRKDTFKSQLVSRYSRFSGAFGAAPDQFARDDSEDADDEAVARRAAQEVPPLAGSFAIPRVSTAYRIGDRLTTIVGRNTSLQTNAGTAAGEGAAYPEVVGRTWRLAPDQATELILSDRRADFGG